MASSAASHWLKRSARPTLAALVLVVLISLPFVLLGEQRALEWTRHFVERSGAALVVALVSLLAADVVLPVPSSWVATLSGASFGFWGGLGVNWLGLNLGALLGYSLGRRAGRVGARRLLGEETLERLAQSFERFGVWSIPLFRGVPVLAEASLIVAGSLRLSPGRYWAACLSSNLGVAAVYAWAGAMALSGTSWLWVFLGSTLLPGLLWLAAHLRRPSVERPISDG
ncbi:MAG: TVP38/TMEM64 family protein [Polyangiaceae bacterium]